ncbi:MAG TPA: zf-HC2 domain-containing protein [Segeticoccus sp.]|uniref:zf-HC2 domain-containing protein n=1 Tax=Segeticoccus sp. TaxID=2706531 RepID=UPI002D7E60CB|nr:zf-HC2 domain-containing protein [Segeticoccus sp.]HET8600078.1 zf-HC2 domain-containing protein [Segeticoccus sp.]
MSYAAQQPGTGSENTWHVDAELLARYVAGALDLGIQSAIEAHVTSCRRCRAIATAEAPRPALERVWQQVEVAVSEPQPSPGLRWATRLGLRESDALVLRASTGLHRPWLVAVFSALVFAVAAAALPTARQDLAFLLVAPLLPALLVAVAYDATDPMRELATPTPFSKLRIALLRSAAAVLTALPIVLAVGLALPGVGSRAVCWLLPSLTLTVVALDVLTWCSAPVTAGLVVGGWLCFVASLRAGGHLAEASTALAQAGFAVATLLGLAVLGIRLLSLRTPGDHA